MTSFAKWLAGRTLTSGEIRFPCPACQPTVNAEGEYRGRVRRGDSRLLILCKRCGPYSDADCERVGLSYAALCDGWDDWTRLFGGAQALSPRRALPPDALHAVYSEVIRVCPLSEDHDEWLVCEGVRYPRLLGYGTLGPAFRSQVAKLLPDFSADTLLGAPGFYQNGTPRVWFADAEGIIAPVRDLQGRIRALKVRQFDREPRYKLLSSRPWGGPGPDWLVHWPLHGDLSAGVVRVTEGERKADVATRLGGGWPCLSSPGAGCWALSVPVLDKIQPRGVALCFDMDATGRRQTLAAVSSLLNKPYALAVEVWDDVKGVDDALREGVPIRRLIGADILNYLTGAA